VVKTSLPIATARHRIPGSENVDPVRDAAELALITRGTLAPPSILAICRGIQILNVALGGTLYQDLDSERPGPRASQRRKRAIMPCA